MMQQHQMFDQAPKTSSLVSQIKEAGQDFEFYPTTQAQLAVIRADINEHYIHENPSVLDCGAGDGRALEALTKGTRYAIEKSRPLLEAMNKKIFVVGTDFDEQVLIDKKVSVVFSNPPYSRYTEWMVKIIKEANAKFIYFVVPLRWQDDPRIQQALDLRKAKAHILDESDFLDAERQARAKVHVLRVDLGYKGRFHSDSPAVDPFELWFDEAFALQINKTESSKYDLDKKRKSSVSEGLQNELVNGSDVVTSLEALYQRDLDELIRNYQALSDINPVLLKELDVNIEGVRSALKLKIEGLKDVMWRELFDNLNQLTERLCHKTRQQMLDKLTQHTHIDFNKSNVRAILIWVLKQSNSYYDEQLTALVESMTEQATISLYKSNQRTFGAEQWRYCRKPDNLERYGLDYRFILHRCGGLCTSEWSHERNQYNGLSASAFHLISDILTVANNLNFDTTGQPTPRSFSWDSNKGKDFFFNDHRSGKTEILFSVRAFANGNLHFKFHPRLIMRLNTEHGRLKGWLKSAQEAADELAIDTAEAVEAFGSNFALEAGNDLLRLDFQAAA